MSRVLVWLVAVAASLLAVAFARPAFSEGASHTYQWKGPSEWTFLDSCGAVPQEVQLQGRGSGMLVDHVLADGDHRVFVHYNDHLTGTGADGTPYRFSREIERSIDYSAAEVTTGINAEWRFRLISQGPSANEVSYHTLHLTTDANGNVVVDREQYGFRCSGAGADSDG